MIQTSGDSTYSHHALGRVALHGFAALVLVFLVSPLLVVLPLSFSSGEVLTLPVPGWSWRWYADFLHGPRWLLATRNSVLVGLATTLVATVLGSLAALGFFLGGFRLQRLVLALLTAPLVVPSVILGVALYLAFLPLHLANTLTGLVLAHSVVALPYVVLTVLAGLQRLDLTLLRAAASLGATPVAVLLRVLLPLMAPSVSAGALFAFATSFDELIVTLFIAGPEQFTLPRQMLAGLREFLSPTICAAAVVLSAVSLALLALHARLTRG